MSERPRIGVYCGSRHGTSDVYARAAYALGRSIAAAGYGLVYAGGTIGLMGPLADGAAREAGEIVGVMPSHLLMAERPHPAVRLVLVPTHADRKARIAEMSDALVALPGGVGVLEEIMESVASRQLGLHDKPCLLLNTRGYFRYLLRHLDYALREGMLSVPARRCVTAVDDGETLMDVVRVAFSAKGWP